MSIAVIINPISGGASPSAARARAEMATALIERSGEPADVLVTERGGHARELARAAVTRGARLVMAWGGDGTINEVACALAFGQVPLGLIPAGSGNGLARELGVSLKPERAIADALGARPRSIDVGEIEGRLFVNLAGVGMDAYIAMCFAAPDNRRRGFVTYGRITLKALATCRPGDYRIATSGGSIETRAILVTIANSAQFGNDARIAPEARLDDGLLDLVVVEEKARWRTLCQVPRLFNGTAARISGYSARTIREATIQSSTPMLFHVDGEPVSGGTTLKVVVHPAALQIAVK